MAQAPAPDVRVDSVDGDILIGGAIQPIGATGFGGRGHAEFLESDDGAGDARNARGGVNADEAEAQVVLLHDAPAGQDDERLFVDGFDHVFPQCVSGRSLNEDCGSG